VTGSPEKSAATPCGEYLTPPDAAFFNADTGMSPIYQENRREP